MQTGHKIETGIDRVQEVCAPMSRQLSAVRCNSHNQCANARGNSLTRTHVGKAEIHRTSLQPELSGAPFGPPLLQAHRGFRVERIADVAKKEQVRFGDIEHARP